LPIQKLIYANGKKIADVAENAESKRGELFKGKAAGRKKSSSYNLYQRKLSEYWGMLERRNSYLYDSGRYLYTGLQILCDKNRETTSPGSGGARETC
jgi:hypothetical protein